VLASPGCYQSTRCLDYSTCSARCLDSTCSARCWDSICSARCWDSICSARCLDSICSARCLDSIWSARCLDWIWSARCLDSILRTVESLTSSLRWSCRTLPCWSRSVDAHFFLRRLNTLSYTHPTHLTPVLYLRVGLAINAVQSSRHNQFAERKQWMVEWMGVHTVRLHVNEQSQSFIGDRLVRQVLPLQLTICESASQSPSKGLNAKSSLQTFMLHIIKQSSV